MAEVLCGNIGQVLVAVTLSFALMAGFSFSSFHVICGCLHGAGFGAAAITFLAVAAN